MIKVKTAATRGAVAVLVLAVAGLGIVTLVQAGFGDPIEGQALFQEKGCVDCHAVRGAGGRIGPDLGRKAVKNSFYDIVAGMWNHSVSMGEKMREFTVSRPSFTGSELADLVSFLYFLNYFDEPGDARIGQSLFKEKNCIQCHQLGGEGGRGGPALDDLPRGIAPLSVVQGIWNHGPAMVSAMREAGLQVPIFENHEIIDLIEYLRSKGRRQGGREFQSPGDPDRGKHLFQTQGCSRCHAVFGKDSGIGPDLGRVELQGSVTQIAARMWNHWPVMSSAMESLDMPMPQFQDDNLADLFAYIFIERYDGVDGDPRRGEQVYLEKRCSTCHGRQAEGDVGPPLGQADAEWNKEGFTQQMWNHAPEMQQMMEENRIVWPQFDGDELANLLSFLASRPADTVAGGGS